MRYRRLRIPAATWFFTVALENRRSCLLTEHIEALRRSVRGVHSAHPFYIIAWVVLPDHIHTVWRLPEEDSGYAMRWGLIKAGFSRQVAKTEDRGPSRREKGERGIWQRRFWEHMIRDERDLNTHIDYIHFNPVKHGLVNQARGWPYSTFHRYVARGDLDLDWGCTDSTSHGFGEPSP